MEAKIVDQDDRGLGVRVLDNNNVEHTVAIGFDGKKQGHSQDGYPDDPDERTNEESEHVSQAQNYARYYVAQETEYDTLAWDLNPDRFETVRQRLAELSTANIDQLFGDLHAQGLSHYGDDPEVDIGDISRPHELPADMIGGDGAVFYTKEIYLDEDDTIETTSGIFINYYVARGQRETVRYGETPDRDPDAKVEVFPAPFVDIGPFRDYLVYNLRCQIRDCYHGCGIEPPEEYKVLGHGQYLFTGKYQHFDVYPRYYEFDATIPGYSYEFQPNLPISMAKLGGMISPGSDQSLYNQIKGTLFSR